MLDVLLVLVIKDHCLNFLVVKEGWEGLLIVRKVLLGLVLHLISEGEKIEHLVEHSVVF